MKVKEIISFIPSQDYTTSQAFYQALGFQMAYVSDDLMLFENGQCRFFLQRFNNEGLANNFVLQISVDNIEDALTLVSGLTQFDIRFEPIKQERWGKVIYLWGPSGELLQLTEFVSQ